MRRSLPEIAAMARKAAAGLGCPPGLAEEAGMLAYVAESHGLGGVAAVAAALDRAQCCTLAGPPCEIARAAMAADRGAAAETAGVLCQAVACLAAGQQGAVDSRDVPPADWQSLRRLMRRGLVPETDASRARGAGPGQGGNE